MKKENVKLIAMIVCIIMVGGSIFAMKNVKSRESFFDEYDSGKGIMLENSGDKRFVFDLDDWGKIDTSDEDYYLQISQNVKLYSVDIKDMLNNDRFDFDESNLKEAQWSDFEKGDLVYYFSERYLDGKNLMKILVVVKGNEVSLDNGYYKNYLRKNLKAELYSADVNLIYGSDYMLKWYDGDELALDYKSALDPENFYDENAPIKFKYLVSTYGGKSISDVYIEEYTKKTIENLEHEATAYFKDIINEDGKDILLYNFESGKIGEAILSDDLEKYTQERVSKGEYVYGEKIAIYSDILDEVVSIKPLNRDEGIENIVMTNIENDRLGFDSKMRRLSGIDKDGNSRELILDKNIHEEYGRWELDGSIAEMKVMDGNYVVDFKQLLGMDGAVNVYRLLAVKDGQIEIGFNNIEDARDSDFDDDERLWIDLADEYTWIGKIPLKFSTGKNIAMSLDENDKLNYAIEVDDKYFRGYYDSKSPLRLDEKQESSMMISLVRIGEFDKLRDIRFRQLKFRPFGVDIVEDTKYYEYNYDTNYVKENKGEWESFWNLDFDKVKGIESKELKNMDLKKGDLCAVTYNGEIGAEFVKLVKLIPSEASIVKGEIRADKFVMNSGQEIELRAESEVITNGRDNETVSDYLKSNRASVKAWTVLDEKGWARYIVIID